MRILILSSYMICPPISGGAKRFLAPVLYLRSNINYSFLYMSYSTNEIIKNNNYLKRLKNVDYCDGVLTSESFQWDWRNIPKGVPPIVWYTMNRDFMDKIVVHLENHTYDAIQVEHSQLAWVIPKIRSLCPNVKIILDYHNMEWLIYQRWLPYAESKDKQKALMNEYQTLREWEEHVWSWFDAIFCISPVEKVEIEKLSSTRTYYVPAGAGIDDDSYLPKGKPIKKYDLFFIGSMNWFPNSQALTWFIEKVMPLIQMEIPSVRLEIAGSGQPDSKMLKLIKSNRNITFWGAVEDERPFLHQSKVFISPIWIGAGVRLKNPTAWAAKLPVVATTLSVEGLEYVPNQDILIGDTPEDFAQKVVHLLKDSDYRESVAEKGYRTYKEKYSLERLMKMWENGYQEVMKQEPYI